jgi:hypothetical protein
VKLPWVSRKLHESIVDHLYQQCEAADLYLADASAARDELLKLDVAAFNEAKRDAIVQEVSANYRKALGRVKELEAYIRDHFDRSEVLDGKSHEDGADPR